MDDATPPPPASSAERRIIHAGVEGGGSSAALVLIDGADGRKLGEWTRTGTFNCRLLGVERTGDAIAELLRSAIAELNAKEKGGGSSGGGFHLPVETLVCRCF